MLPVTLPVTLPITLAKKLVHSLQLCVKMEHIGTLPDPNTILLPTIIPLYRILSPPAEKRRRLSHLHGEKN